MVNLLYKKNIINYSLLPFSYLYRLVVSVRRFAYQKNIFKKTVLPVPIIVIGNITLGGTGKTPLVIWLVEYLIKNGFHPGVVSRGYGGKSMQYPKQVSRFSQAAEVGDEPLLIHLRTQCPMVVDPKRVNAAKYLLAHSNCDVIISDDGLQHYALNRTLEIAVVDGMRLFGNGFCLPAGPLREAKSRIKKVDFQVINEVSQEEHVHKTAQSKNVFKMHLKPQALINVKTLETKTIDSLRENFCSDQGAVIHAVAGIGNPERFFKTLRDLNFKIIEHKFPDHYHFNFSDLNFKDNLPVVMTEKDAIKCQPFATEHHWYLPVAAELDHEFGDAIIKSLVKFG